MSALGIIVGNRDFFPDHLITEARNEILSIFKNKNIDPIILYHIYFHILKDLFLRHKNVQNF